MALNFSGHPYFNVYTVLSLFKEKRTLWTFQRKQNRITDFTAFLIDHSLKIPIVVLFCIQIVMAYLLINIHGKSGVILSSSFQVITKSLKSDVIFCDPRKMS